MTSQQHLDRVLDAFFQAGSDEVADRVIDGALLTIDHTPQRRAIRVPWRFPEMNSSLKLATAAGLVVAVGALSALMLSNRGDAPGALPRPTTTAIRSAPPSAPPTAAPSASPNLLDTSTWTTYVSARYGFSIAHPADWIEQRSDRDWTLAKSVDCCPPDTAYENFILPGGNQGIVVSVWSVAVGPGTSVDSWLQAYCPKATTTPCTGIQSRAVPATMDGHTGSLVPFEADVQAFFLVDDRIYAIACWRPELDFSVYPYSGSQRLVETFLSTMDLLPGGPVPSASPRSS